jgi:membrane-associated phospholipid phosphatase
MIGIIRKYPLAFMLFGVVLATGTVFVLAVPRPNLHLALNSNHSPFQDVFFRSLTLLGNGWFALGFSVLFLLVSYRCFFMLILSYSISGLLAQFVKHAVFPGAARPAGWMDRMPGLPLVPGVDLHHAFSFPSGHATTAFAVLLLAGLVIGNRPVVFGFMMLAWCVAFSRVYLSQHFLDDILAGALLGTLSALFFYWYFNRLKRDWLDRSLRDLFPGKVKKAP